jgi:RimJ/RimL family protein N-acetyltransferase
MSSEPGLRTPRLVLRPWRPEDHDPLVAINRDPEVTEFLDGPVDEAATATFLAKTAAHWGKHGFGHFAVEGRTGPYDGRLLGFVGVAYPTFLPEVAHRPELGWRLAREAWGEGLATEAALAARDDALGRLQIPELISIVHPRNRRSRRVAEKLGMGIEGSVSYPALGGEVDVWRYPG